nr:MBL fold metallo-hydrolase [Acuticoccus mangrovi]
MGPRFFSAAENRFAISFHSFLIRSGGLNILIDTCNGNHKTRATPAMYWQNQLKLDSYMKNLAALGLTTDDIHIVMCTHLHTDHVGWNTRLENGEWVPTFKNARYIFGREEYDFHVAKQASQPGVPIGHGSFADSVVPVVEAGMVEFVDSDFRLLELDTKVALEPAPGHTPGHCCVALEGDAGQALITADTIHHPIQMREPWLDNVGDLDPAVARATRQAVLGRCADEHLLMLTSHFVEPTAGYVRRDGELFEFDFSE